ncbi:MAG: signal peptidase II [Gammaproteobacteria bacterium]
MNEQKKLVVPGASQWLWLAVVVVVLDQVTKWIIVGNFELYDRVAVLPVFELTRLHNTGAAFSFLSGAGGWQRWFFVALALVVSIVIMIWLRRTPKQGHGVLAAGLALILGGATGNVIDRIFYGYVIDFLHFHWGSSYFPAFNIADSAITIGAGLLIIDALFLSGRQHAKKEQTGVGK